MKGVWARCEDGCGAAADSLPSARGVVRSFRGRAFGGEHFSQTPFWGSRPAAATAQQGANALIDDAPAEAEHATAQPRQDERHRALGTSQFTR